MGSVAYAQNVGGLMGNSSVMSIVMIVLMIAIFYFLLIRPQSKKEKDRNKMINALQRGDKVLTTGGIYGTISHVRAEEGIVVIQVATDVKIEISKAAIVSKVS